MTVAVQGTKQKVLAALKNNIDNHNKMVTVLTTLIRTIVMEKVALMTMITVKIIISTVRIILN